MQPESMTRASRICPAKMYPPYSLRGAKATEPIMTVADAARVMNKGNLRRLVATLPQTNPMRFENIGVAMTMVMSQGPALKVFATTMEDTEPSNMPAKTPHSRRCRTSMR
ncbi:MAG: hypothetical protein MI923_08880 [Phycisphaerales bacterium]|nr:hypothetical protein [Phycisphaerales bacterium]